MSYHDRNGYAGTLIVLVIGAAFLALAIAPYALTIAHVASVIAGAR